MLSNLGHFVSILDKYSGLIACITPLTQAHPSPAQHFANPNGESLLTSQADSGASAWLGNQPMGD